MSIIWVIKTANVLQNHYMHRLPTLVFLGFPCGSTCKDSTCNAGDLGSIPGLGISPGEGKGYPLQYSGLENSVDSIVYGVTKSRTLRSDFHFCLPTFRELEIKCCLESAVKASDTQSFFLKPFVF